MNRWMSLSLSFILAVFLSACSQAYAPQGNPPQAVIPLAKVEDYDVILEFPSAKYPETAKHIKEAIAKGESDVCTIDRKGAKQNREESLKGVPTKKGYDRDEFPMAMCAEGGKGADVKLIPSKDNRGSGSWVGHQLEKYPDGTRVKFVVK